MKFYLMATNLIELYETRIERMKKSFKFIIGVIHLLLDA